MNDKKPTDQDDEQKTEHFPITNHAMVPSIVRKKKGESDSGIDDEDMQSAFEAVLKNVQIYFWLRLLVFGMVCSGIGATLVLSKIGLGILVPVLLIFGIVGLGGMYLAHEFLRPLFTIRYDLRVNWMTGISGAFDRLSKDDIEGAKAILIRSSLET